jgi:L-threonylcarbamoyladenylate synthase
MTSSEIIPLLKEGGIGVLPTDTIYGIVACALDPKAVERVYEVRKRRPDKPCIILIADIADLLHFGITIDQSTNELINRLWPGPVSIVLPCAKKEFAYLHRGTHTLAFRLPADETLREFLRQTGPLIAPSANPEGQTPAADILKARQYFDDSIDFYVDAGMLVSEPSTVIAIEEGKAKILRQGSATIPENLL